MNAVEDGPIEAYKPGEEVLVRLEGGVVAETVDDDGLLVALPAWVIAEVVNVREGPAGPRYRAAFRWRSVRGFVEVDASAIDGTV